MTNQKTKEQKTTKEKPIRIPRKIMKFHEDYIALFGDSLEDPSIALKEALKDTIPLEQFLLKQ